MKTPFAVAAVCMIAIGCRGQAQKADAAPAAAELATEKPQSPPAAVPEAAPGAATAPVRPVGELPDVVATVDGEKVERWELDGALKSLEARAGSAVPAEKRDEVVRGLIDQLVAYHVLSQEARDRKLGPTKVAVTERVAQIKGGFPNPDAFQQAMTAQGMTLDRLERQTRMGMEIDAILEQEVASKVEVDEKAVGDFYRQNLQQFAQGESVHASHIVFSVPQDAGAAQKQAARAKAQQALDQVKSGADFAQIAREQSQDPGSAPGGGDLGFFPKGQTDPAFETAAFGLKPGGLSDVVETQFGFHVIKVHEHRAARTAPLEEVSGQIREYLSRQQRDAKVQAFIEAAKAKRKVQIFV